MHMSEPSEAKLIEAWHSSATSAEVCSELELTSRQLSKRWRKLRIAGKLPDAKRKHAMTSMSALNHYDLLRGELDSHHESNFDGRPSLVERDRLLERLPQVHKTPRLDLMGWSDDEGTEAFPRSRNRESR